ncbi:MAG: hypothetical protein ACPGVC_08380 [Salibacteraceae bacterium]
MKGILSFALLATILLFGSCRESDRDRDTSTGSSVSAWNGMNHFHNIMREIHNVAQVDSTLNGVPPSDVVTPVNCMDSFNIVSGAVPGTNDLKIYYSKEKDCLGTRNRSGVITANFDGLYSAVGTTITVSLQNYEADDFSISGDISMKVVTSVIDTLSFDVEITNGKIIDNSKSGNNVSYFTANLLFINNAGRKTVPTTDDQFVVYGGGNGMAENGVIYSYTIDPELVLIPSCEFERFGTFNLSSPNAQERFCNVNEGDGCDKIMLVTIDPANGSQVVEMK